MCWPPLGVSGRRVGTPRSRSGGAWLPPPGKYCPPPRDLGPVIGTLLKSVNDNADDVVYELWSRLFFVHLWCCTCLTMLFPHIKEKNIHLSLECSDLFVALVVSSLGMFIASALDLLSVSLTLLVSSPMLVLSPTTTCWDTRVVT